MKYGTAEYYPNTPVYQVISNQDLTEGRGRAVTLGHFLDKRIAGNFAHGRGVMGTDAEVRTITATVVRLNGDDFHLEDGTYILGEKITTKPVTEEELLRQQALEKLTPAERKALGL